MKSIVDLMKQDTFDRTDLKDIITFIRCEGGSIAPLCAVAYIKEPMEAEEAHTLAKFLEKYPELAAKF